MSNFLYSVEREYQVPVSKLWDAWTDPTQISQWYCPTDLAVLKNSTVSEPVVGGWWTTAVEVAQFNMVAYFYGKYTELIPNKLIVHSLYYTESVEDFEARDLAAPSHEIRVELDDRGQKSWAKFSQFGELPEGQAQLAQAGMESYFDNLEKFLSA